MHSDAKVVAPSVTQETLTGLRPDYVYTIEISVKYSGENSYAPNTKTQITVATQGENIEDHALSSHAFSLYLFTRFEEHVIEADLRL